MYYSLIGLVAMIVHAIMNFGAFSDRNDQVGEERRYKSYMIALFVYFLTDTLWGVLDYFHMVQLLKPFTVFYYLVVAVCMVIWCLYVISFLRLRQRVRKVIVTMGIIFGLVMVSLLVANHYSDSFYFFDQSGLYQSGKLRYLMLAVQILIFVFIAILSFIVAFRDKGRYRGRFFTIGGFNTILASVLTVQVFYPTLPLFTIGLMLCSCLYHVFVQEAEKAEYRKMLQKEEDNLKEKTDIISNAGYGIWKIGVNSKGQNFMIADDVLQDILGVKELNLKPADLYTYYHERLESAEFIEKDDYSAMKEGQMRSRIVGWNHPEKGHIYLSAGGSRFITSSGENIISGYCADVTEQHRNEMRSSLIINSLAGSYEVLNYITMSTGRYIISSTNNEFSKLNYAKNDGLAMPAIKDACLLKVSEEFREEMEVFTDLSTINERIKMSPMLIHQFKDENGVWHEWSYIVADRNEDGTVKYLIWTVRQVEDEKQAELRKQRIIDDNITANREKTRFLQNVSHEIRTPLNSMYGFAQLLGMPDGSWSDEEKDQYNSYIENSYNMLEMLIGDIIDIADSENGNYRIDISDVNVNAICRNALMSVDYRRPIDVEMYYTSDVADDYVIRSDGRRIQQVLVNYLTNACKNTTEGSIHMHCSNSEHPGHLTFSVTDTGIGVPAEKADLIFKRFTKIDPFIQGSGLGLNICQMVADKLGGEVYLDKTYTAGARFVFVL